MQCENFLPYLDAYADNEFDTLESDEMDQHLTACSSCREKVESQINWKRSFRDCLSEDKAPEDFRSRILGQIKLEHAAGVIKMIPEKESVSLQEIKHQKKAKRTLSKRIFIAIPIAAIALLSFLVLPQMMTVAPASSDTQPVVDQAIDWHRGNYPIEVTGPEKSRVASWFHDKVKFPVRLPKLRRANLLGGRIANMKNQRAAYILYDVDGKRVSVMLFDGKGLRVPKKQIKKISGRDIAVSKNNGYNVALLQEHGITYAITSDLPEEKFNTVLAAFSPEN